MEWFDIGEKLPSAREMALFWVKYESTIWHARPGWIKEVSDGILFVIPSSYIGESRQIKCWTTITPPEGF